jgi:DNA-directed RNA polymerase subunit RPC12/RpoP
MAVCAHCKKDTKPKDLQLIRRGNSLFYGCERCSQFFESLQKAIEDNSELLSKLNDYDLNGVPYWNTESEKSAAAVENNV